MPFVLRKIVLFFRSFSWFEVLVLALFVGFYSFYIVRLWRIGRVLNTPFYTILVKIALRISFLALLIIAYLGPSFGLAKREIKSIGKDIMICVDLSKSMDAFDIQPTRLEKIKYEMKKIVAAFNSDRVGVIIFSSEAF
ncbi:MAG: VWA domain-containing protein, partial [Flammeovirgaceae bacterium]